MAGDSQGTIPEKETSPARGAVIYDKSRNQYIVTTPGAKGKTGAVAYKAPSSKSVGKDAFKGIYAKATVNAPKKKLKAYKKLLKVKGVGRETKFKL